MDLPSITPYVAGAVVLLLLAPILVGVIRRVRSGAPTLTINSETGRIAFGSVRRGEWRQIDHDYTFTDLGQIEVLRNYESRPNARRTGTVALDSYELNLYFHTTDTWVGVTESRDRRQMQWESERISQLTKVPVTERNAPELAGRAPIDRATDRGTSTGTPNRARVPVRKGTRGDPQPRGQAGQASSKGFPFHFQLPTNLDSIWRAC